MKYHKKSKIEETIDVTNKLVNEIDNAQNEKQKKVYTQVFNAYLTPSSIRFLK